MWRIIYGRRILIVVLCLRVGWEAINQCALARERAIVHQTQGLKLRFVMRLFSMRLV